MENWITEFIGQYGYASILFLITLENVFPPIPSEIILTFGGFMTNHTHLTIPGVLIFATVGSVLGAIILYGIGYVFDVKRLEKIIGRWGQFLGVNITDIHKADSWFKRYGYKAVFFCRMVPLIRSLISIPAGMSKMKFGYFVLFTTVGTFIWNTLLVCGGALLGESWGKIVGFMDVYSHVTYIVLGILTIAFLLFFFWKKWRVRLS